MQVSVILTKICCFTFPYLNSLMAIIHRGNNFHKILLISGTLTRPTCPIWPPTYHLTNFPGRGSNLLWGEASVLTTMHSLETKVLKHYFSKSSLTYRNTSWTSIFSIFSTKGFFSYSLHAASSTGLSEESKKPNM